jgi:hypothetical protein
LNKAPDYLSYSQFDSMLTCGERYRLQKIEQVPEQPAWYLAGGSAVHEASEVIDHAIHKARMEALANAE